MKCPECSYENKEGRKFCSQCGSKLGWKCSNCDTINDPEDKFCDECGADLQDVEQKVVGGSQVVEIPTIQPVVIEAQRMDAHVPIVVKSNPPITQTEWNLSVYSDASTLAKVEYKKRR